MNYFLKFKGSQVVENLLLKKKLSFLKTELLSNHYCLTIRKRINSKIKDLHPEKNSPDQTKPFCQIFQDLWLSRTKFSSIN